MLAALPLALLACGPKAPAAKPDPQGPGAHVDPATDLVIAAGMTWMIDLRMREIAARAELIPAIAKVIPEERFRAFAAGHGGVDLRQLHELTIARYGSATLWLARGVFDPAAIERAFTDGVALVEGRSIDRKPSEIAGGVTRAWGKSRGGERVQIATIGREAVALEVGTIAPNLSPLRVAQLFAEGKLKKASPALRTAPLDRVAQLLGDAPARAFAPGPFEGEWAKGFAGLLGACTAAGIAVRPERRGEKTALACTLVLLGEWKRDAAADAKTRLVAWADAFGGSSLGRLLGVDRPLGEPRVRAHEEDALILELSADAQLVAQGLHDAVEADVKEIMSH